MTHFMFAGTTGRSLAGIRLRCVDFFSEVLISAACRGDISHARVRLFVRAPRETPVRCGAIAPQSWMETLVPNYNAGTRSWANGVIVSTRVMLFQRYLIGLTLCAAVSTAQAVSLQDVEKELFAARYKKAADLYGKILVNDPAEPKAYSGLDWRLIEKGISGRLKSTLSRLSRSIPAMQGRFAGWLRLTKESRASRPPEISYWRRIENRRATQD